jgi:hypothetical protein
VDVLGAERVGCECGGEGRVDPTRQAENRVAEAVLAEVVGESQLQRVPYLLVTAEQRLLARR